MESLESLGANEGKVGRRRKRARTWDEHALPLVQGSLNSRGGRRAARSTRTQLAGANATLRLSLLSSDSLARRSRRRGCQRAMRARLGMAASELQMPPNSHFR